MYKIIIAGSRHFNDYQLLKTVMNAFLKTIKTQDIEIVSGTARGADRLGEQYAKEMGYKVKRFPADWNKYGKSAGYIRNAAMAKYADACIVFWDGQSKGSKHMIDLAKKENLYLKVIRFK